MNRKLLSAAVLAVVTSLSAPLRRRMKLLSCLLAGLLAWAAASPAEARGGGRAPPARSSLDEAVVNVRRDTGGRVLSAEPRDGCYRIKVLLPDASVRSFDVQAGDRERR